MKLKLKFFFLLTDLMVFLLITPIFGAGKKFQLLRGELCLVQNRKEPKFLTNTDGTLQSILISSDGKFLACSKYIGHRKVSDANGNVIEKDGFSILIYDCLGMRIRREIKPVSDVTLWPRRWDFGKKIGEVLLFEGDESHEVAKYFYVPSANKIFKYSGSPDNNYEVGNP